MFKKRISLINHSGDELTLALKQILGSLGEVISRSPYDSLALKVDSFIDRNLGIDYPNAVVLTGRTVPLLSLRTGKFLRKLIDVNEALVKMIKDALDRLQRL